ncbi:TetR/AcrR family transcriptional regulator [Tritonibacter horizontis]|uniref:HTH-type transcriptional regulator LuxR n=1 Tax=Tritonibacter horizontis TaxID=1768241 RepID=A0A132C2Q0_9RHOB|nr:TetR/AcrR family transcriptional regulator [Tritonibacter horizontis]KUP94532.1 HTH-type transcriptional regulator LuxR [Tritonibacter horizontis]
MRNAICWDKNCETDGFQVPIQKQSKPSDGATPVRKRLSAQARRAEIVQAAIELFSETGFDGSTRDVARRAGITQPLLYRYFPNKENLIEAVYSRVFLETWDMQWDGMLLDRTQSVRDRFQRFYEAYTETVFQPVWLRLWYFALLRDANVHAWYREVVQEQILKPLVRERRVELGRSEVFAVTAEELDATWLLHGGLLNYGLRQQAAGQLDQTNRPRVIAEALDMYMLYSAARMPPQIN